LKSTFEIGEAQDHFFARTDLSGYQSHGFESTKGTKNIYKEPKLHKFQFNLRETSRSVASCGIPFTYIVLVAFSGTLKISCPNMA